MSNKNKAKGRQPGNVPSRPTGRSDAAQGNRTGSLQNANRGRNASPKKPVQAGKQNAAGKNAPPSGGNNPVRGKQSGSEYHKNRPDSPRMVSPQLGLETVRNTPKATPPSSNQPVQNRTKKLRHTGLSPKRSNNPMALSMQAKVESARRPQARPMPGNPYTAGKNVAPQGQSPVSRVKKPEAAGQVSPRGPVTSRRSKVQAGNLEAAKFIQSGQPPLSNEKRGNGQLPRIPRNGANGNGNGKPPKPRKKGLFITANILFVCLSLIVGIVGGAMVYAGNMFSRLGTGIESEPEDEFEGIGSTIDFGLEESVNPNFEVVSDVGELSTTSALRSDPMIQNILLLGSDKRQSSDNEGVEESWRADTIMILSIDRRHKTLKLTSVLRDTYVHIPGYHDDRINAAFSYGGAPLMMKTIESNFGIKLDRYATVNFQVFQKIVDIIGGVDLEISAGEAKEINKRAKNETPVEEGFVHLNGNQTLQYTRIRKIDDDFARTSRQRKVLEIIIEKFKGSSLSEINSVLYEVLPLISTNLSQEEILGLAGEVMTLLHYPLESLSIPADNTWSGKTIRDMSVLVLNMEENRRIMSQFIFESGLTQYYGNTYSGYTYGYGYGNGYGYGYCFTKETGDSENNERVLTGDSSGQVQPATMNISSFGNDGM